MSPGRFVTLAQIKYSLDCRLRPQFHQKILDIMQALADRGYGIRRSSTFYKNPMLSSHMLSPYNISVEAYQSALHSTVTRYGITPTKKDEHNDIHESLYGFNSMLNFASIASAKAEERKYFKTSPKKVHEPSHGQQINTTQPIPYKSSVDSKPPALSYDEHHSDDSLTYDSGPPIYQAGW